MIDMQVKDYRITSDNSQIVVNKLRRDEEGNVRKTKDEEDSLAFVGYYGTLEHALNGIVRDDIVTAFKNEIKLGVGADD